MGEESDDTEAILATARVYNVEVPHTASESKQKCIKLNESATGISPNWDDAPPLPPPPDHTMPSPMVQAVLESWTQGEGLHESMLAWMDGLTGVDPESESIPPLTISSLDHKDEDVFFLHVLPLILR